MQPQLPFAPFVGAPFGLGTLELLVIFTILSVLLVCAAVPAILAFVVLNRIPPQFRRQEPGLAFLLLIPLFASVWNFFVHPKIAESLKAYFDAQGSHAHGDCGRSLALAFCICSVGSFVPLLGLAAGPAALVLLILFYVKTFELSALIPKGLSPLNATTAATKPHPG
jgi:hypothetical protein